MLQPTPYLHKAVLKANCNGAATAQGLLRQLQAMLHGSSPGGLPVQAVGQA